ncbi:hypothetical protein CDAR_53841 [Caerostris darwini]|uniref:Uncharacterized protein n=1 Tax=Caerostris darwini TaxID=1538125 RepID=A0AAV4Q3X2_9ARAC|nr:hypothetical protein CDAR_53841 [Caerostris darwini]
MAVCPQIQLQFSRERVGCTPAPTRGGGSSNDPLEMMCDHYNAVQSAYARRNGRGHFRRPIEAATRNDKLISGYHSLGYKEEM